MLDSDQMLDARFRCPRCGRETSFTATSELPPSVVDSTLGAFRKEVGRHLVLGRCSDKDGPDELAE